MGYNDNDVRMTYYNYCSLYFSWNPFLQILCDALGSLCWPLHVLGTILRDIVCYLHYIFLGQGNQENDETKEGLFEGIVFIYIYLPFADIKICFIQCEMMKHFY